MISPYDPRMSSPIPAPSEAQLDAGADRNPNAHLDELGNVQPELTPDQINTSIDGNAPHTQPDGAFTGSEYPVDPANPNDIPSVDQRLGNVAGVEDLDEDGQPTVEKTTPTKSAPTKSSKAK